MTRDGVPVIKGKRGRGMRSKRAKLAKRAMSTTAIERRRARPAGERLARDLVRRGLVSDDVLDSRRPPTVGAHPSGISVSLPATHALPVSTPVRVWRSGDAA